MQLKTTESRSLGTFKLLGAYTNRFLEKVLTLLLTSFMYSVNKIVGSALKIVKLLLRLSWNLWFPPHCTRMCLNENISILTDQEPSRVISRATLYISSQIFSSICRMWHFSSLYLYTYKHINSYVIIVVF